MDIIETTQRMTEEDWDLLLQDTQDEQQRTHEADQEWEFLASLDA